jgi:ubiquinone/menaquinone biosynthesis C-methylase UbiE
MFINDHKIIADQTKLKLSVQQFYNEIKFPGPYTLESLNTYGNPIENKYLRVIEQHIEPGQTILDAGCGTGLISNLFALRNPGTNFVSVDFADSICYAEIFAKQNNLTNVTFIKEDLVDFATDKKFDVVVCQGVLHHIPQYKLVLDKLLDLVSPNGKIILGLYHPCGAVLKHFIKINYTNSVLAKDQQLNPLEFSFTYDQVKKLTPGWKIVSASPSILGTVTIPALLNPAINGLVMYVLEREK